MRSRFKERIYKIWNPTSSLQLDDVFLSNLVSRNRINPVFFNQLLHDIIGHYGLAEKENLYFFEKERDFLRSLQISAPSSVRQHVVSDGAHVAMLKMSISTNSDFKNTCLAALLLPGSESGISVNFTSIRSFSFSVFSEIGHSTFWFWNYVFKNLLDTWNGLLYSTPTFFYFPTSPSSQKVGVEYKRASEIPPAFPVYLQTQSGSARESRNSAVACF